MRLGDGVLESMERGDRVLLLARGCGRDGHNPGQRAGLMGLLGRQMRAGRCH